MSLFILYLINVEQCSTYEPNEPARAVRMNRAKLIFNLVALKTKRKSAR